MDSLHYDVECIKRLLELQSLRLELIEYRIKVMNAQIKLFTDTANAALTKLNTTTDNILAALAAGGSPGAPLGADDLAALGVVQSGLTSLQLRLDAELAGIKPAAPPNIVSITSSGTVATVTDTAHGFTSSQVVTIAGATGPDAPLYNGAFPITVTDADHFTYVMTGVPASATATGTITAK